MFVPQRYFNFGYVHKYQTDHGFIQRLESTLFIVKKWMIHVFWKYIFDIVAVHLFNGSKPSYFIWPKEIIVPLDQELLAIVCSLCLFLSRCMSIWFEKFSSECCEVWSRNIPLSSFLNHEQNDATFWCVDVLTCGSCCQRLWTRSVFKERKTSTEWTV